MLTDRWMGNWTELGAFGILIAYAQLARKIRPLSAAIETPFEWRFVDGPIVARDWMLTGWVFALMNICSKVQNDH